MGRQPYQLSSETRTTLADLLQLLIQTGQLEAHSTRFRLCSFNSVTDFKKDFGIPNHVLLPAGLHRGRSFTVSLKAHTNQLIDNNYDKVWEIEPGDTDSDSGSLWLDAPVHKSLQRLTFGIQRLTDYIRSVPAPIASVAESTLNGPRLDGPATVLPTIPYGPAQELATQLVPLFALLIDAGQLVEHTADFYLSSFNLPADHDSTAIPAPDGRQRSYHIVLEASVLVKQEDRLVRVWELNPRRNELGSSLSFYPNYERAYEKLQSAVHRLQDYLREH